MVEWHEFLGFIRVIRLFVSFVISQKYQANLNHARISQINADFFTMICEIRAIRVQRS